MARGLAELRRSGARQQLDELPDLEPGALDVPIPQRRHQPDDPAGDEVERRLDDRSIHVNDE